MSACTLIVIPRDRFSLAAESFASLRAHTPREYPIIYVDSCHPQPWADELDRMAANHEITLIRTGFLIGQGEAYNLALPHVKTPYVMLVDNDVLFTPGWIEAMLACAEETGATAVMPLVEEKEPGGEWKTHMCGGDCGVAEIEGRLQYTEVHPYYHEALPANLTRCSTGVIEFHSLLVRRSVLEEVGPFDENIWHFLNHVDFSLCLRAAGGTLWQEPRARVQFQVPPAMDERDLGFFLCRWNPADMQASIAYFSRKWSVEFSPYTAKWSHNFRRRAHPVMRAAVHRRLGKWLGRVAWRVGWTMEPFLSNVIARRHLVSNRRERLTALGAWRNPMLSEKQIEPLARQVFGQARSLGRELPEAAFAHSEALTH